MVWCGSRRSVHIISPILLYVFVKRGMTWQIHAFSHEHADHVQHQDYEVSLI